jgi:hypothetical protein
MQLGSDVGDEAAGSSATVIPKLHGITAARQHIAPSEGMSPFVGHPTDLLLGHCVSWRSGFVSCYGRGEGGLWHQCGT